MTYKVIDHTADVCVRVSAKSLKDLLKNAAKAMMRIITNPEKVKPMKSIKMSVKGDNKEEVLVKWLQEILYKVEVKKMLFKDFEILDINDKYVSGKAYGENIDLKRHDLLHQIKAITHHNLKIKKAKDKLTVDIVFDI